MRKKEIYIYNILNKIRGIYSMDSGLVELTSKGLMQCNNNHKRGQSLGWPQGRNINEI